MGARAGGVTRGDSAEGLAGLDDMRFGCRRAADVRFRQSVKISVRQMYRKDGVGTIRSLYGAGCVASAAVVWKLDGMGRGVEEALGRAAALSRVVGRLKRGPLFRSYAGRRADNFWLGGGGAPGGEY